MTKPDTGGRAIPTKLAAAKSIADNDYSFAAPEGHFARVTFSTRYSAQECKQLAAFIAAAPDVVKALEDLLKCCEVHPAFTKTTNTITIGRMNAARAALSAKDGR